MGLIWTVQIVIYPLFDRVGRTAFAGWHEAYMRHIGYVVGPLMLVEAGTAAWLLWDSSGFRRRWCKSRCIAGSRAALRRRRTGDS